MKRMIVLLTILAVLFVPLLQTTYADDPAPGSKEDNACNPGGVMDGKCDTQWEWTCGWYMARFNSGAFTRAQVIKPCESLLPPAPPASAELPFTYCIRDIGGVYTNFAGGFVFNVGTPYYSDPACTVMIGTWTDRGVYAPPPFDPNFLCNLAFGTTVLGGPFINNVYTCK